MKTSLMASMNAPFVQMRSAGIRKFGLAGRVGLCSISAVSRNGQRMKVLLLRNNKFQKERLYPLNSGGVQAATYQRMFYHLITHVGVRKRSTPDQYPGYHHTLVDKAVVDLENFQRLVRILVNLHVMLDLVRHVRTWGLNKVVFVASNRRGANALRPIMSLAGVVKSLVVI